MDQKGLAVARPEGATGEPPTPKGRKNIAFPLDLDPQTWHTFMLETVGDTLARADGPMIIGCSALKRSYRDIIRARAGGPVTFVHLAGSRQLIGERMTARTGHFMPPALLDSQFAALEPPAADEDAVTVDVATPLDDTVTMLAARFLGE